MKTLKQFITLTTLALFLLSCAQTPPAVPTIEAPPAAEPTTADTPPPAAEAPDEPADPGPPSYQDAQLPVEERVADLLGRMSLDEKIGQMTLVEKNSITPEDVTAYFIGGVLSGGGGYPAGDNTPEGWLEMVNGYQTAALATPLAIPMIYGVDAVHGHNNLKGATIFPHNIGLGATGNAELVEQIGRATAIEVAASGIFWNYAPVLAVPQDIRWGRTYEGYSENTELVTELGVAYQRGLQGDSLSGETAVLATPKHYIADGGTTWGTSTTGEYQIDQGDAQLDEATLRAIHLPPYIAAIESGARSIMVSFSSWNGTKMHAEQYLISDVLKGELGFTGFVVSDWGGVDQISPDYGEAVTAAINAGIDMNMVPYDYERFINALKTAVEQGDVSQERIDDAVTRILRVKFEMGLFDRPLPDESQIAVIGRDEHRQLAREAVRQSLVLLKNENDGLPIPKTTPLIFVGGEAADDIGIQSGGWTIEWQGASGNITPGTTILDGIEATVSPETSVETVVHFNRFGQFERVLDEAGNPAIAPIAIAVIGERPYAEGLGDNGQLTLSEGELTMLGRLRERSEKLIVIVVSGRPIILPDQLSEWDALVAAWLPGTEGAGVADLLFGDYPFIGKLPYTWPRSIEQLPFDFANLAAEGEDAPLFPFGYGLTE